MEVKTEAVEFDNDEFQSFFRTWRDDIERYFPHFDIDDAEMGHILKVTCDGVTVGYFVYTPKGEEVHLEVDYVCPEYRDRGIGAMVFGQKMEEFKQKKFDRIVSLTDDPVHIEYIKNIGFRQSHLHEDRYELSLDA